MTLPPAPSPPPALPAHPEPLRLPEHAGDAPNARRRGAAGPAKTSATVLVVVGIALVVVAAVIVLVLVLTHRHAAAKERAAREGELAKGPRLAVTKVELSRATREVSLPGEVRGFNQATLYAKISGYVSEIHVDRGDRVKAGDVLAVVLSPEAQDDVLSARSNREFTKRTAQRLDVLAGEGIVSMIDRDNATNAALRADADLKRARTLFDYTRVRAPFDGIVTARYVDVGALVPAATSATQQAQPVVDVAEVDRVRVFAYLGQDVAQFVKAGDAVLLYEDERPAQRVPAAVTRVAGALDPRTRTMQCEIDVDNRASHFLPGTFVHVRLSLQVPPSPVIPNDALVTRDGTPHVVIIEAGRARYRAVEVGNNDGKTTRIASGLAGGEKVGINVPVQIDEGDAVQEVDARKPGGGSGSADSQGAAGSPTSTPTSEARPQPAGAGPKGKPGAPPEPNVAPDNGTELETGKGAGGAR